MSIKLNKIIEFIEKKLIENELRIVIKQSFYKSKTFSKKKIFLLIVRWDCEFFDSHFHMHCWENFHAKSQKNFEKKCFWHDCTTGQPYCVYKFYAAEFKRPWDPGTRLPLSISVHLSSLRPEFQISPPVPTANEMKFAFLRHVVLWMWTVTSPSARGYVEESPRIHI